MEVLSISWSSIGKILAGVGVAYVLAPVMLVLRSYVLLKIIEKFIATSRLHFEIGICESDRWNLINRYEKDTTFRYDPLGKDPICTIEGESVSYETFKEYEEGQKMHKRRFDLLDTKINTRQNLIHWLTKHFKEEGFNNPIPEWRKEAFERVEEKHRVGNGRGV